MINIYDQSVPNEQVLSKADIAEIYGVSVGSVPTMVYRGTIPAQADNRGKCHGMRWFVGQIRRAMKDEYKSFLRVKKPLTAG